MLLTVLTALVVVLGFIALAAAVTQASDVATLVLSIAVLCCASLQVYRDHTRRGDAERRRFLEKRRRETDGD